MSARQGRVVSANGSQREPHHHRHHHHHHRQQQQQQQQQPSITASTSTLTPISASASAPTPSWDARSATDQSTPQTGPVPVSASSLDASSASPATSTSASTPLSSRVSPPLDLSTVERRGQPNAVREFVKPSRPFGLREAPTFSPSEEEFRDPLEYIKKIAPEGRKYGICKIIPPAKWNPPFALATERFHFRTRKQELNSVDGGTRATLSYLDQLQKFHRQNGMNLARFPSVDKRPLDLYKLKKAVEERGGFDQVCKQKKWAEIGRDLGYSGKIMSSLSTSLKNSYQRWLHPYEEYLKAAKPAIQKHLAEQGKGTGVSTPDQSPAKKSKADSTTPAAAAAAAVAAAAAAAATATAPLASHSRHANIVTPASHNGSHPVVKESPAPSPHLSQLLVDRTPEPAMRHRSGVPPPPEDDTEYSDGHIDRRRKRIKRERSTTSDNGNPHNGDGSTALQHRQRQTSRCRGARSAAVARSNGTGNPPPDGRPCEVCGTGSRRATLLVCDGCSDAYHMSCLNPPLESTPEYDWHCARCLVGTGEYGFEDGDVYSLKEFQEKADTFRRDFLEKHRRESLHGPSSDQLTTAQVEDLVETEFWRLLQSVEETVEVEYGADIHCMTHGSAFPTLEKNPLDPYSTDGWNLNVLPLHGESLFRHIRTDISGMTVPWAYVGMMFSTFCWHNEDHYAYSANYQHFGATKTWYGIPGDQAELFEEAMRQHVPDLFETQPDLLFQLVTLLPPDQLQKAGVDVYALDQRAGQFVLTFPKAYHAGFNHGFNFNEAVNFAPTDWEPLGYQAAERLQQYKRQPCFSHDELLFTAAASDLTIATAQWLAPALQRVTKRELDARAAFSRRLQALASHTSSSAKPREPPFTLRTEQLPEEEYQCAECKGFTYLSQVKCLKSGAVLCLTHAEMYGCCEDSAADIVCGASHALYYQLADADLIELANRVTDRAEIPQRWAAKLDSLLSGGRKPSIKALQALVHEGEKIPHPLDGLADLVQFVRQCNDWIGKATVYITRKQQNRRKNEMAWRRSIGSRSALASALSAADERELKFTKTVDDLRQLVREGEALYFDCPQITALNEKLEEVEQLQSAARHALSAPLDPGSCAMVEELCEQAKRLCVNVGEVERLEALLQQMKWIEHAAQRRGEQLSLDQCQQMIKQGESLGIPDTNEHMLHYRDLLLQGQAWEAKALELISMDSIHFQQLDALAYQASRIPVSPEMLAKVRDILVKQREAERQVKAMNEASKHPDILQRPLYKDLRELVEALVHLNSKPAGYADLEREKKRHEDWMRKGKKLFGKGNAPLHILKMHMQYVARRNAACFDLEDQFRPPVEPPSREPSPDAIIDTPYWMTGRGKSKDVFCLCRQQESGLMIECGRCHEWYHGKCLKIARGKVKEDDDYVCPICDWRVKIPRDAARPKLEDLLDWQAEIPQLPFQPEEEALLATIVNQGVSFRQFVHKYTAGSACVTIEELPMMIFYLRKIEGAEILLAFETNYFRQTIHKLNPVADAPPPTLYQSLSTRKPRPTKQQKLMKEHNVDRPEDLPLEVRRQFEAAGKRKSAEAHTKHRPAPPAPRTSLPATLPAATTSAESMETLSLAHPLDGQARELPSDTRGEVRPVQAQYTLPPVSTTSHSQAQYNYPSGFSFEPRRDTVAYPPPTSSAFYHHFAVSPRLGTSIQAENPPPFDPEMFSSTEYSQVRHIRQTGLLKADETQSDHQFTDSATREDMDEIFANFTNQEAVERPDGMEEIRLDVDQATAAQDALDTVISSKPSIVSGERTATDVDALVN